MHLDQANHLTFRNSLNQSGGTEPWGVRNVSLLSARPEGVGVSDVAGDDGDALLVSWELSVDDAAGLENVDSYRILRSVSPVGPYVEIGSAPEIGRAHV